MTMSIRVFSVFCEAFYRNQGWSWRPLNLQLMSEIWVVWNSLTLQLWTQAWVSKHDSTSCVKWVGSLLSDDIPV